MSFSPLEPYSLPELPPPIDSANKKFYESLLKAKTELAELKGYVSALPEPMLLLNGFFLKEAVASSKIEHIEASIEKTLQQQLFPESEQKPETKETLRYKTTMLKGFETMKRMPLGNRLILDLHKELMPATSYGYRTSQKQILNPETNEVIYTAPPAQKMNRLMTNWENYLNHSTDETDPLIRCAILHYQLEAIHPFSDGDGRTGRIVMALYFLHAGVLQYPITNISTYINENRTDYSKLMLQVTEKGHWENFISYMLHVFTCQAKETRQQLSKLVTLYNNCSEKIKNECPNIYSEKLVELLFSYPMITPVKLGTYLDIHYTTATRYLKTLVEKKLLHHQPSGKYQLYINKSLIDILNSKN